MHAHLGQNKLAGLVKYRSCTQLTWRFCKQRDCQTLASSLRCERAIRDQQMLDNHRSKTILFGPGAAGTAPLQYTYSVQLRYLAPLVGNMWSCCVQMACYSCRVLTYAVGQSYTSSSSQYSDHHRQYKQEHVHKGSLFQDYTKIFAL